MRTTAGLFSKKAPRTVPAAPFQAVCTALAGTVGTDSCADCGGRYCDKSGRARYFGCGVPALLGMCTKFAEVTLAVHYRERSKTGEWVGGPMYYIKNGLGRL